MKLSVLILCALVMGCGDTPPPCSSEGDDRMAPSAGCLVREGDAALLVRSWLGEWALPGGSVKPGESASCGAEREVFEETGIPVTATRLATPPTSFKVFILIFFQSKPFAPHTK